MTGNALLVTVADDLSSGDTAFATVAAVASAVRDAAVDTGATAPASPLGDRGSATGDGGDTILSPSGDR